MGTGSSAPCGVPWRRGRATSPTVRTTPLAITGTRAARARAEMTPAALSCRAVSAPMWLTMRAPKGVSRKLSMKARAV
jgi:hypothetical protein